jgi:hypothetical protein
VPPLRDEPLLRDEPPHSVPRRMACRRRKRAETAWRDAVALHETVTPHPHPFH